VITHAHHIQEERLFDCYFVERSGELLDPPLAEHLAECAECGARYGELTRFMDGLRAEADMESAAVFTPERLHAQQQQIARRLEHASHAARVISFPGRSVSRHMNSTPRVATRWIAAAAAAGLFVGLAVGMFSGSQAFKGARQMNASARQAPSARPAFLTPAAPRSNGPTPDASDDVFMSDLDVALERPRTRELLPFEALTPYVREVSDRLR
jgi:hypothetical protein